MEIQDGPKILEFHDDSKSSEIQENPLPPPERFVLPPHLLMVKKKHVVKAKFLKDN